MRSERLRRLVKAEGPFASVYFDDSHDTAGAVEQLEAKWRDIRRDLEDMGAGTALLGTLEGVVLHHRPAVGRRGRALIATSDRVLVDEQLSSPPPSTVVRFSAYPYILPLVTGEMRRPVYVFAAVDHTGADVSLHEGETVRSTSIEGAGRPAHKPATAGWNGYGDLQHATDEAVRMNCRAIADHLTRLVDDADPEVIFISGAVPARADLLAELPQRVAERVSQLPGGARKGRAGEDEIDDVTTAEFARRRGLELTAIADRFESEIGRGSGLAAQGLGAVCEALRAGDVDTLIVGELGDTTVVTGHALTTIAPDSDVLSELGEPAERIARADEALPFAAIAVGASLTRANDLIAPADGIAALLRYAANERLSSQQP
ncbi:Rv2629 family ribosome hibernation factor [Mycobacterium stomatepiae]|uniref:Peptide chain release factor 1 n=1 Tax=Mycobacterium stomatepiae TaxID=470076 RepID=A0A7I7Q4I2_9MYCO|nr:hypothetical protein [Mycobacterium stomatepiae]MCV7163253.1 hypothetical protein [Mycobacterium stomatepiae]BBY21260.1 hypothetical protein MSTO_14650 [Mycobacterium stomatepiae]